MNKTIRDLSDICKEHRFDEKLLFVPSYAVGHQIGESLARAGHAWINLRPTTVSGYAQGLVGIDLARDGIRLIDSRERLMIVEEIFRRDKELNRPGSYFAGADEIPGILKCLGGSIHELRMEGFEPEDLDPSCFIVPGKGEALRRLLSGYEKFLTENGLIDRAGLIDAARRVLKEGKVTSSPRIVMVLSDLPLSGIEKDLVRLAGGDDLIVIGHEPVRGLRCPKRFSGAPGTGISKPRPVRSDIELLPFLFEPEEAPPPVKDNSVSLFHALGESNEVREVLRRVLASGTPLDDVEIVLTKSEPYAHLLYEITRSLEVPATFSGGVPITYTRPGKGLILYLQWQSEDFPEKHLMRLFGGGYLDIGSIEDKEKRPSPARIASMLREAGIGWGRDRYEPRLNALKASYLTMAEQKRRDGEEEKALFFEELASRLDGVVQYFRKLFDTISFRSPVENTTLQNVYRGAMDFVDGFCRVAGELDAAARGAILDALGSMGRSTSATEPAGDVCARLIKTIHEMTVGGSNPKPGHMHVSHYRSFGYTGRRNLFLIGLDQAGFPGPLLQDPILLDRERQNLGHGLLLSGDRMDEDLYTMAKALSSLPGCVTLSFSCRDLREDREMFPSALLLGVYRLISGKREGDYSDLKKYLGKPSGFTSGSTPLNDWEWWLAQKEGYGRSSVFAAYPDLKSGTLAEEERDKEAMSEYDGWIRSSEGILDPLREGVDLSCSRLESLAKCPFAYFIHHVLNVEPLEEMEKEMLRWLEPLQKGELLHEVFHRFMAELVEKGDRPSYKKHLKRLQAIAMEAVERWKAEIPPAGDFAFEREKEEILLTLEIFLKDEEERCKEAEPLHLEISFDEKIGLGEKKGFTLRGRIDRVDRVREHEYEVWDYKTGSSYGFREEGYLDKCRHLQHALYGLAAELILRRKDKKARVVRSGYFFPSPKGEGLRIVKPQVEREKVYRALGDLFELLRTGVFPASCDKDPCGICDYTVICGGKDIAVPRSKRKLEKDRKMAALERVMNHA